ncbi:MAG: CRISPR-associated protein Cas4 [Muribaculaceae bacterium]|nr:CRISPR-associated protein Cas4 [Muribaculaceae bacterium]
MPQPKDTHQHYSEEEMLQLSGIQHYVFCPRQWALIHIEQIWADNTLTAEGSLFHQNVDNPYLRETNGSPIITLRSLRLSSPDLGLSGMADAVEIIPFENAPRHKHNILKSKLFTALPIEYKRGKPKTTDCDRLQVAAQAIILEEMLSVKITQGAIFYWEIRHREYFDITEEMRAMVRKVSEEMHTIVNSGVLPKPIKKSHCRSCSLLDYCLPSLTGKSAKKYLQESLASQAISSDSPKS